MAEKVSVEDNDIKLIIAFQKGDEFSFNEILNKYEKPLINFIYRFIGSQTEAEDIVQEVFIRVYKSAANYKPSFRFSTWIYKIATNLCIDYHRKRKIKTVSLNHPINTKEGEIKRETTDLSQATPDISIEKKQISETIQSALLSLPVNQRIALTLKVYENKSYREISEIIGCSVPAVESLLFRARLSLRNKLAF